MVRTIWLVIEFAIGMMPWFGFGWVHKWIQSHFMGPSQFWVIVVVVLVLLFWEVKLAYFFDWIYKEGDEQQLQKKMKGDMSAVAGAKKGGRSDTVEGG